MGKLVKLKSRTSYFLQFKVTPLRCVLGNLEKVPVVTKATKPPAVSQQ